MLKIAIVLAVLLVVLQEAKGDWCYKSCTKWKRSYCYTSYYYSWYYGYRPYTRCYGYKSYKGSCPEYCRHGGWSNWSEYELYNECPVMCGGSEGNAFRTRTCTNPTPYNGGRQCEGEDSDDKVIPCNTPECGDKCPSDKVKFHKHPELKHMYYHCDPGHKKAFLRNCTVGTVFDETSNTCVHASASHGDCEANSYDHHPDTCSKFLMCVNGRNTEMACSKGLHWNNEKKYCDWPATAGCEE